MQFKSPHYSNKITLHQVSPLQSVVEISCQSVQFLKIKKKGCEIMPGPENILFICQHQRSLMNNENDILCIVVKL